MRVTEKFEWAKAKHLLRGDEFSNVEELAQYLKHQKEIYKTMMDNPQDWSGEIGTMYKNDIRGSIANLQGYLNRMRQKAI